MENIIFEVKDYKEISRIATITKGKQAILTKLTIKHMVDDVDSANYLLTELDYLNEKVLKSDRYSNEDIKKYGWDQVRDWVEDDNERFEEYGYDWHTIGVGAEAVIYFPFKSGDSWNFKIQKITSGGIWGIETDSEGYMIKEEEYNELCELGRYLRMLDVNLSLVEGDLLDDFEERYSRSKDVFISTVVANGKVVNTLGGSDAAKVMDHAEGCVCQYREDEGLSQIAVYRTSLNGDNERMFEFLSENQKEEI